MYRPVSQMHPQGVQSTFFSEKNHNTLHTVLLQDFQSRHGPLNDIQVARLDKTLDHYVKQVYEKQGDKPLVTLNKEVLGVCAKDFSQYLQRNEAVKDVNVVKKVMDDGLFMETSQRFERIAMERNEVKALPPSIPDFHISLSEDGPPAAEMYERAKKAREMEALWSQSKADAGVQNRVAADGSFHALQDAQNRSTELALIKRQTSTAPSAQGVRDTSLAILPDRRELLMGSIGSFDGMNGREAASNPAIGLTQSSSLAQHLVMSHPPTISYREVENNLFIYSADRDWLKNNKENRYHFTVNFDPAANTQAFGPSLASQQKFKNIVRIELVKAIVPGEGLSVTVNRTGSSVNTAHLDNVMSLPYVSVHVAELENNNFGTDNVLDRSFGVVHYDSKWGADHSAAQPGYISLIPKFLKCQKDYYPTPLSTLQKLTVELRRPNGELVSVGSDTFDILGVVAPQSGSTAGVTFPFTVPITFGSTASAWNVMLPSVAGGSAAAGDPANLYLFTTKYFNQFEVSVGDRIQISGYSYNDDALNDPTYGQTLRAFSQWITRAEGHVIVGACYSPTVSSVQDGVNDVGYANGIVIPTRYQDPTTGSVLPWSFGANFGATLNAFGAGLVSPIRLINMSKQTSLVFRIITREMDALPSLRPENNQ